MTYASGGFFCNNATHIFTYDGVYWLCMDWNTDNDTTYSNFVKSGAGAKAGLVPAPSTTAGTSKYLREDGTWQTPPDTKTSVVNNQTTTVAGYALDARQANPNLDGTLAKQLSDLNGSLENLNNFTDISKNDNLNDVKFFNVGKYRCSFNGVAATVLNSPFNTAFTMEAFQSAGTPQYIAQKAIEFESGHCKWRMRDTATGTIVQDWVQLY